MSSRMLSAVATAALFLGGGGCTPSPAESSLPKTRTYFIAADEVVWDYAPSGVNRITGKPFDEEAAVWAVPASDRLGRVYRKTVFREYTDDTFATLKVRPPEWEHLGMLGPLIRAEVGDTIRVTFKNNGRHPFSLHPHGVFYSKDSEGAQYEDGTDRPKGGMEPGTTHTFVWLVPERAGPASGEGTSSLWMYHSHIDEEKDVNAGLIGPLIISARGSSSADGAPLDVDREIVAAFIEVDENVSWHFDENIATYAEHPTQILRSRNFADPAYVSNLKETINGFLFGHTAIPAVRVGERVRWYLFASTNFEVHAPHWHGNTVVARHMRTDVVGLLPMDMVVANMVPDNPGTWLFHCHTGPHLRAGMQAKYVVLEPPHIPRSALPDDSDAHEAHELGRSGL